MGGLPRDHYARQQVNAFFALCGIAAIVLLFVIATVVRFVF